MPDPSASSRTQDLGEPEPLDTIVGVRSDSVRWYLAPLRRLGIESAHAYLVPDPQAATLAPGEYKVWLATPSGLAIATTVIGPDGPKRSSAELWAWRDVRRVTLSSVFTDEGYDRGSLKLTIASPELVHEIDDHGNSSHLESMRRFALAILSHTAATPRLRTEPLDRQ